jgi:hypothetical protein
MQTIRAESRAMRCASRLARIIAGYRSKVQPRRPLARLATLMLIAAVAPPMASAEGVRGVVIAGSYTAQTNKADKILRDLLGSHYDKYEVKEQNRLRECTRDDKCLGELKYGAQFSRAR